MLDFPKQVEYTPLVTTLKGKTMIWSAQQNEIFHDFKTSIDNLVVVARAGTGKTTTILEGIGYAPESSILLAAFNKKIAVELQAKLKNPRAEAATMHSVGFKLVKMFWGPVRIAEYGDRARDLAKRSAPQAPDVVQRLISKLHSLCREMVPFATNWEDLVSVALEFDCEPEPEMAAWGWGTPEVCAAAYRAMMIAKEKPLGGIDFADMLYLPLVNGWVRPMFELVVIDEAQDMNPAQIELARRLASKRVVMVGDDKQAIYGFRGADSGVLGRMVKILGAKELKLTTTYRCGKEIVREAQSLVPDFQAGPDNPSGIVREISKSEFMGEVAVGDVVLSRTNAAIVPLCLRCYMEGTPAKIEGKDLAESLRTLVKKLATGVAASSIPQFLEKVKNWEAKEVDRLVKAYGLERAEAKIETTHDKADVLRSLAHGAAGVPELKTRIDRIFNDINQDRCITFSTIHKAKGLEWDRVFLLDYTMRRNRKTQELQSSEEANIRYVGITRAKSELVLVDN